MSNEKMREEFEAWATESTDLWLMPVMFDGVFVNYYDEDTADAFNVWKASRAALFVELPSAHEFASDSCELKEIVAFNFAISVVDAKLKSVGIKCK